MAKRLEQKDCEYICKQMYDFWLRAYQDKLEPDEVFPSDDLLDEMHLHDAKTRERVSLALQEFMQDFSQELLVNDVIETVVIAGYDSLQIHRDSILFHHCRPADIRFVFS